MRGTVAIVVVLGAGLAIAQTVRTGKRPVLHEDLPPPASDRQTPMIGQGSSGANPTAFAAGDKVLPKPSLDHDPKPSGPAPQTGQGAFSVDRQTEMKPDNHTGADGALHYVSVFNPDVIPFKRMSVFDGVGDDYTFKVAHAALVVHLAEDEVEELPERCILRHAFVAMDVVVAATERGAEHDGVGPTHPRK